MAATRWSFPDEEAGATAFERLTASNRRLAAEIRAGEWDVAPPALRNLLMAQTRARPRRVNPKYLKARENFQD